MNTKKIIFILMIVFFLLSFSVVSFAVELNMTDDTDLTINTDLVTNNTNMDTNTTTNNANNTNSDDYNTTNEYGTQYIDNSLDLPATVSSVDSVSDDGLQLSDILNIILIVIGILLILLSIAILIRLKK